MRIYLVGGAVRDELLGFSPPDRDYVVLDASEEEFLRAYPGAKKVGRDRECVFIYRGCEYTLSSQPDIWSDLRQRDLTVNAVAQDEDGRVYALEETWRDLRKKVLRPVHRVNFYRDPLRVYRSARMAACFPGFSPHPELHRLMREIAKEQTHSLMAPERVCSELRKSCSGSRPGRFFRLLDSCGLLTPWFRELDPGSNSSDCRGSSFSRVELYRACQRMDRLHGDSLRVWMGLCASLGLSGSTAGHPDEAKDKAIELGKRLKMATTFLQAGKTASAWIRQAAEYDQLEPQERVELLQHLRQRSLEERMMAVAACVSGKPDSGLWRRDLERISRVRLPPEKRGLGPESGRILKRLRCRALAEE